MANFKPIQLLQSQLESYPIKKGQLLFTIDTYGIYVDISNSQRKEYREITLMTSAERTEIIAPIAGFYYETDTNKLFYYNKQWIEPFAVDPNTLKVTYSNSDELIELQSGETLSTALSKVKTAVSKLISHLKDYGNPHKVTKAQLGLGSVENKTGATIRSELTKDEVVNALGYTPPEKDTNTTYNIATETVAGLVKAKAKTTEDTEVTIDAKTGKLYVPSVSGGVGKDVSTGSIVGAEIFNDYENNVATGNYAHAEGTETDASADFSHAEGYLSGARGIGAHAEGYFTLAQGEYSHAEGYYSEAYGDYSHVEGEDTIAKGYAQHVQGSYNIEDPDSVYLHIVGNGEDTESRSNAHTLDWDGNAWYAGKVSAGTPDSPADPTEDNDLATKKYVDDHSSAYPIIIGGADLNGTIKPSGTDANAQFTPVPFSLSGTSASLANITLTDLPLGIYSVMIRVKFSAVTSGNNSIEIIAGGKTVNVSPNMASAAGKYATLGFMFSHETKGDFSLKLNTTSVASSGVTGSLDYIMITPAATAILSQDASL